MQGRPRSVAPAHPQVPIRAVRDSTPSLSQTRAARRARLSMRATTHTHCHNASSVLSVSLGCLVYLCLQPRALLHECILICFQASVDRHTALDVRAFLAVARAQAMPNQPPRRCRVDPDPRGSRQLPTRETPLAISRPQRPQPIHHLGPPRPRVRARIHAHPRHAIVELRHVLVPMNRRVATPRVVGVVGKARHRCEPSRRLDALRARTGLGHRRSECCWSGMRLCS